MTTSDAERAILRAAQFWGQCTADEYQPPAPPEYRGGAELNYVGKRSVEILGTHHRFQDAHVWTDGRDFLWVHDDSEYQAAKTRCLLSKKRGSR